MKKFIKLQSVKGNEIHVRVSHVSAIERDINGMVGIVLITGAILAVKESHGDVKLLLGIDDE